MIVKSMNESAIYAIGHAFGYYDYGEETGMVYAFFGQEPTAQYICAYVRGMLRGGFLHTTSERGEGYIAYKRPKEKLGFKTLWPIATGMLHNSSMKRLMRFAMAIKKGGKSLQERMDKEKKPYIFVGMVCVCEKYQGQGYMRKAMDIAFAEGNRLHVPVILETLSATSTCTSAWSLPERATSANSASCTISSNIPTPPLKKNTDASRENTKRRRL